MPLEDLKLDELKALAQEHGVKKAGVGWPICCPPAGNKADIIVALTEAGVDEDGGATPVKPTEAVGSKTPPKPSKTTAVSRKSDKTWAELAAGHIISDGRLYRPVQQTDELMQRMLADQKARPHPTGIRMPIYEPLATCSFAAKDLDGNPPSGLAPTDRKAGRDPWSICDYLRDALQWPASLIFIDAENNGWYDVDHFHLGKPEVGPEPWQWKDGDCPGCHPDPAVHKGKLFTHEGSRNWKAAFTWAQEKSHVMLYFVSREWMGRANCVNEFKDHCTMVMEGKSNAVPVMAVLDPGLRDEAAKLMKRLSTQASTSGMKDHEVRHKFGQSNIFDLSDYMAWSEAQANGGGKKMELRAASRAMQLLRDRIKEITGGSGRIQPYLDDMNQGLDCVDLLDDQGNPCRNRYKEDVRRVDINRTPWEKLVERLPNVGETKAEAIVQYRERIGGIRCADQLYDMDGFGELTIEDLFPFVSFGKIGRDRQGRFDLDSDEELAASPEEEEGHGTRLEDLKLDEIKALAQEHGVKKNGVSWSTCCPPAGNKADIIAALREAGVA